MAKRPTAIPQYSVSDTWIDGPDAGDQNKASYAASAPNGFIPGQAPDASMENSRRSQIGDWFEHLAAMKASSMVLMTDIANGPDGTPFELTVSAINNLGVAIEDNWIVFRDQGVYSLEICLAGTILDDPSEFSMLFKPGPSATGTIVSTGNISGYGLGSPAVLNSMVVHVYNGSNSEKVAFTKGTQQFYPIEDSCFINIRRIA